MKARKGDTERTGEGKLRQIAKELKSKLLDYIVEKFIEKVVIWVFSALYAVYREFICRYVDNSDDSIIPAIVHHKLSILLFGFLVLLGIAAFVAAIYRFFKRSEK